MFRKLFELIKKLVISLVGTDRFIMSKAKQLVDEQEWKKRRKEKKINRFYREIEKAEENLQRMAAESKFFRDYMKNLFDKKGYDCDKGYDYDCRIELIETRTWNCAGGCELILLLLPDFSIAVQVCWGNPIYSSTERFKSERKPVKVNGELCSYMTAHPIYIFSATPRKYVLRFMDNWLLYSDLKELQSPDQAIKFFFRRFGLPENLNALKK